jgi:hypothetical protein
MVEVYRDFEAIRILFVIIIRELETTFKKKVF